MGRCKRSLNNSDPLSPRGVSTDRRRALTPSQPSIKKSPKMCFGSGSKSGPDVDGCESDNSRVVKTGAVVKGDKPDGILETDEDGPTKPGQKQK